MRVLVTGAAGFIGLHAVRALGEAGHAVLGLDFRTRAAVNWNRSCQVIRELCGQRYGYSPNAPGDLPGMVQGDVLDTLALRVLIREFKADAVLHLAAESHVDFSLEHPAAAFRVNAEGTMSVGLACIETGVPLVYLSTDEVYGDLEDAAPGNLPVLDGAPEEMPLHPSSPYSAGKAAGEQALLALSRSYGLQVTIVRSCNAFGPFQVPEKLVPIACRRLWQGQAVPVHGDGRQVRQWVAVEELALFLRMALDDLVVRRLQTISIFNVAGPRVCSVNAIVNGLAEEVRSLGTELPETRQHGPDRPGQDRRYHVSGARVQRVFNWAPQRDILQPRELFALLQHYGEGEEVSLARFASGGVS